MFALDQRGDLLGVVGDEGIDHDLRVDSVGLGDLGDRRPVGELLPQRLDVDADGLGDDVESDERQPVLAPWTTVAASVRDARSVRESGPNQDVGTDLDVRECPARDRTGELGDEGIGLFLGERSGVDERLEQLAECGFALARSCSSASLLAVSSVSTTSLDVGGAAPVGLGPRSRAAVTPPPSTAAATPPAIFREWGSMFSPFLATGAD